MAFRSNLGLAIPSLLLSVPCPVVVDHINLHLPQRKSFLMLKTLFKIENRLSKHECACIVVHMFILW